MRAVGSRDDDVAGAHLPLLAIERESRLALLNDEQLVVRVPVQPRAAAWRCVHKENGDVEAVVGADKLVRDGTPGQIVTLEDVHEKRPSVDSGPNSRRSQAARLCSR